MNRRVVRDDLSVAQIFRLMRELEPKSAADFVKCLRSCARGSVLRAFDRDERKRETERALLKADAILSIAEEIRREKESAKSHDAAVVGGGKD